MSFHLYLYEKDTKLLRLQRCFEHLNKAIHSLSSKNISMDYEDEEDDIDTVVELPGCLYRTIYEKYPFFSEKGLEALDGLKAKDTIPILEDARNKLKNESAIRYDGVSVTVESQLELLLAMARKYPNRYWDYEPW